MILFCTLFSRRSYCDSSYDGVMGMGYRRTARDDDRELSLLSSFGVDDFAMCFGRYDAGANASSETPHGPRVSDSGELISPTAAGLCPRAWVPLAHLPCRPTRPRPQSPAG